jgi:sulfide:quinone oxidoreductase
MEGSPLRVLIAGGGIAGLETLTGLRELAADRVSLTLVAPDDEFVFHPIAIRQPYSVEPTRGVAISRAAKDVGAKFVAAPVEEVDAGARTVQTSAGERIGYDAFVLALGADAIPSLDHVMTWDDRSDSELLGGLLRDVEEGYAGRVAVVIPPGPGWPLRGYELALLIRQRAWDMSEDLQTTLVVPDPSPFAEVAERAAKAITAELERAGITIVPAEGVSIERGHDLALVLQPSAQRIEVDRVIAMPILRGRPIDGIPVDEYGFVPIDARCGVAGLDGVWATGDCTAFPLKSGGVSAEQADVVAANIAALAGADVEPRSFDPDRADRLAGLPAGRFIEQRLAMQEPGMAMHVPTTGVPILTYLQRDLEAGWRGAP